MSEAVIMFLTRFLITAEGTSAPGEVPLDEVTATCTTTLLGRSMRLYLVPNSGDR